MSDPSPQPYLPPRERPPDELVLAAVERAVRHEPHARAAVRLAAILEHLDLRARSAAARHVRARLSVLLVAGRLERTPRHGVATWALSDAGVRELARARTAARVPALRESPQHRAWRNARVLAAQESARFHDRLRDALVRASALLTAEPAAHSDAWFALGDELARQCWLVGSARHCAFEWREPDDARADLDSRDEPGDELLEAAERALRRARRRGRRNVHLW